ncbi:MAG: glycosyl hydrolase family 98, partial [Bacteroidaceae bacterium]|nr:glycosyl hydrolase family 98 [Bacteroidaceae bacterium]
RKIIDGTMYIPSRKEVVENTKIVVVNDINNTDYEQSYAAWGNLYDGLYKQDDPFNKGNGQWMDNYCYFKKTGRYATIPVVISMYDSVAKAVPVQVKKSSYQSRWGTQTAKVSDFNKQYPEVSTGDLYVSRRGNQLITYTPYTYLNKKKSASALIPLLYNRCDTLELDYGKLSSGTIREFKDSIVCYLNNYRSDSTSMQIDQIILRGAKVQPTFSVKKRNLTNVTATSSWDETTGVFKINLKHMGGVDLLIRTPGDDEPEGKLADASVITPLGIPQQPEAYKGEIIIEAEDMDFKSIKSNVTDPYGWYPSVRGHAGNGFADMGTNTSGSLRHQLNSKNSGPHTISVRYTSPSKDGKISITVNGTKFNNVSCPKTATNEWRKVSITSNINEGKNNLIITNTSGVGMYIDQIIYTPADVEEEKFLVTMRESENGVASANVSEAVEGEVVQLTVTPKEGFAHVGWEIIHGNVTISEDNTFVMPDDIVTLQPLFADQSAVYALDYTNSLNGSIPEGWRVTQGDNDIHEYPNSYSSGSRMFVGFNGYQGKALYWRVNRAEYGMQSAYPLTLQAGTYKLTYAMAAWKGTPKYKVSIINKSNAKSVLSTSYYNATPNADGNTGADISSAKLYEQEFNVTEPGNYVIRFQNNGTGFDEFLLLECRINLKSSSIDDILLESVRPVGIYDINGVRRENLQRGLNIIVTSDGKVRKFMMK